MSALAAAVRYRSLVDRLGAIVWEAIPGRRPGEATFTFVSEHTESLLGYPARRWKADPRFWFEITHPGDRERVNAAVIDVIRQGRGDFEYRVIAADGRELWLRSIAQVDTSSGELRLTGVLVDVTGRKAADARLLRLQDMTDALSSLLSSCEAAQVIAAKGRAAVGAVAAAVFLRTGDQLELLGYDGHPDERIDGDCRIPLDADVPAAEAVRTGEAILLDATGLAERYPGLGGGGKLAGTGPFVALPLTTEGRVLGSIALRLGDGTELGSEDRVVLDVLERASVSALLRAEQSATERDSRAVLDTIITTAPEAFALFDTSLRYVRVNDALAELHGLPAIDHIGRALGDVVPDSGHAGPLLQVLETGEPIMDVEVTGAATSGSSELRTWLASYYPVRNDTGAITFLGKFMTDITARKRGEARAQLFGDLGTALDSVITAEARMEVVVRSLVPATCRSASVSLRAGDGTLDRVAWRGTAEPQLTVPLLVRGRDLGVLDLTFATPGDPREDRRFAVEIARRAALAIDNARLLDGERVARERTAHQYAVAAALGEALSAAEVAAVTLEQLTQAVGADHGTMWLVGEDETTIEAVGWQGFEDAEMQGYTTMSVCDRRPVADAIRSRRINHLATPEEMDAAYPAMAAGLRARDLCSIVVFPLITAGRVTGGLLLSATRAHAFSDEDLALGMALGSQAAQALERARLYEAERHVSVTLQRALLPASLPDVAGVELDLRYLPAAGLDAGGDFYEAVPLADGSLVLAVGDVVGRGPTAAAAMGQLRSALRAFALTGDEPGPLLTRLSAFADTVSEAMAATAVVAKLDPAAGRLRYACAGHPWPVLVSAAGTAELLAGGRGVPLGCLPEPRYAEDTLDLEPGATLLLYTDGLTERRGEDMDAALERLRVSMAEHARDPLPTLLDRAIGDAGPVAPADDVAVVVMRFTGAITARRHAFAAELDQVPVARHALRDWLAGLGVGARIGADILLAAGEAVANAVEHSGSDRFELELAAPAPGAIRIVVRDHGSWRDPVVSPHRGRGFGLMRTLMDECAVQRSEAGTVVRLAHRVAGDDGLPLVAREAEAMTCTVAIDADGVAVLSGDLDLAGADAVRRQLSVADLSTVDLSGVTHLDSTGARMLFELPARPIFIAPPGSAPRRMLDLSSLAGVMNVRDAAV